MTKIINLEEHRQHIKDIDILATMYALDYEAHYHEPPEESEEAATE